MTQTISKDSRQIPKKKDLTSDKKYNDLVYGWLQAHSEWDQVQGHKRWLDKRVVNFSKIADDTGICRQTVSTKVKNLISMGLLSLNNETGRYELVILEKDAAMLIDRHTLDILVSAMNTYAITTYVYLYSRYYANSFKPFDFYMEQLKAMVNLSGDNRGTNEKFSNILIVLQKLGLLKYEYKTAGADGNIKSNYRITWMTNKLE